MNWVTSFYSQTGTWWGPAEVKVSDRDYQRLETVKRLVGKTPSSVLELGSSYGNTASVMADNGIKVVGIEISDRADFAKEYLNKQYSGSLEIRKDDFYKVELNQKFDVICYWNGFGIGRDEDQKRLLKRISEDWLNKEGVVIMDIQNPATWKQWHGSIEHLQANAAEGYRFNVSQSIEYDDIRNYAIDTWWETEKPENKYTQTLRCYTPDELVSLLDGSSMKVVHMEANGSAFDWSKTIPDDHPFWKNSEYLVQLKCF